MLSKEEKAKKSTIVYLDLKKLFEEFVKLCAENLKDREISKDDSFYNVKVKEVEPLSITLLIFDRPVKISFNIVLIDGEYGEKFYGQLTCKRILRKDKLENKSILDLFFDSNGNLNREPGGSHSGSLTANTSGLSYLLVELSNLILSDLTS